MGMGLVFVFVLVHRHGRGACVRACVPRSALYMAGECDYARQDAAASAAWASVVVRWVGLGSAGCLMQNTDVRADGRRA